MKIVPTKATFVNVATTGLKGGVAGGVVTGIVYWLTRSPFVAQLVGGILGGAMVDGDTGKMVAVNGVMDAVTSLFIVGS
jgi:hypothetical protein